MEMILPYCFSPLDLVTQTGFFWWWWQIQLWVLPLIQDNKPMYGGILIKDHNLYLVEERYEVLDQFITLMKFSPNLGNYLVVHSRCLNKWIIDWSSSLLAVSVNIIHSFCKIGLVLLLSFRWLTNISESEFSLLYIPI